MKLKPREKILLCLCVLCFVVWVSDSLVIESLQARYTQSQEHYRELAEERMHKEHSFREFSKKADSQNSKAYIHDLESVNSELEALYIKLWDKTSLESLISLTQPTYQPSLSNIPQDPTSSHQLLGYHLALW